MGRRPTRGIAGAARLSVWLSLALVGGCVPVGPKARPLPPPSTTAAPRELPAPQSQTQQAWDVAPLAAGDWTYSQDGDGTVASFGAAGAPAQLVLRCHPGAHEILVSRIGASAPSATMIIRTSAGVLSWNAVTAPDDPGRIVATRPASDPGFDWIAYSRGRFSVEVEGMARLVVPAWAEVSRVIEDCRG